MTDRICETFTAPTAHRIDALLEQPSLQLGLRALTVYGTLACTLRLAAIGDVAECGVADGKTAYSMLQLMEYAQPGRVLHLFDTFGTVPIAARNNMAASAVSALARSVADVSHELGCRLDEAPDDVVFHAGLFSATMPVFDEQLCFIHADGDLYESTLQCIELADRCLVPGGCIVFDDYGSEWTGVTRAVDERLGDGYWTYAVAGVGQLVAIRK